MEDKICKDFFFFFLNFLQLVVFIQTSTVKQGS